MPATTLAERVAQLRDIARRLKDYESTYTVCYLDAKVIEEAAELLERLADQVDEPPTGRRWTAR